MFRLTVVVLVLFTALLSSTACTRQVRTASFNTPQSAPRKATSVRAAKSAVQDAIDRQVRNAVDAGEGDPVAQALRLRVSQEPSNLEARMRLAEHYREMGHPDLAAEHLRLAAERFSDRADVQIALAKALRDTDASESAAAVLRTFLQSHESAEASSTLGVIEDDLGRLIEAEAAHRRAAELQPKRASYWNNLGYNLLLQGKREEASQQLRNALAIDKRNETARNNLAMALAPDHPEEAIAHWSSISDPATAHSNLAAVLIEQGKLADARGHLATALGYQKDHPAALRNLALLTEIDGKAALPVPVVPKTDRSLRVLAGRVKQAVRGKDAPRKAESTVATSGKQF